MPDMNFPTIENFVGNTPLVRLQRLPGETSNVVLVKLEGNNPAGSVKDRPALSMIRHAEARGDLQPGDTLIEATSGNTGIATRGSSDQGLQNDSRYARAHEYGAQGSHACLRCRAGPHAT